MGRVLTRYSVITRGLKNGREKQKGIIQVAV